MNEIQWEYLAVTMDETGRYVVESKWDATPPSDYEPHGGSYVNKTWASINDLGRLGWELVSVQFIRDSESTGFFKRSFVASAVQHFASDGGPLQLEGEDIEHLASGGQS